MVDMLGANDVGIFAFWFWAAVLTWDIVPLKYRGCWVGAVFGVGFWMLG